MQVCFVFDSAPRHFLPGKGPLWGNCKFLLNHFNRGHHPNYQKACGQSSSLFQWSTGPVVLWTVSRGATDCPKVPYLLGYIASSLVYTLGIMWKPHGLCTVVLVSTVSSGILWKEPVGASLPIGMLLMCKSVNTLFTLNCFSDLNVWVRIDYSNHRAYYFKRNPFSK